jgi:hexosaminidase
MPAFARRAYMLDISRDRVPTMDTLDWLVRVLAAAGFNELQLYVEHTFAYTGHETVWSEASPMTHVEMQSLDTTCGRNGIDLVVNMNVFGHMERWLAHEEYRPRAECPDGYASPFGGGSRPAGCLEPTKENAELAVSLARDIASTVVHNRIHIGGDEPFELGDGRSSNRVGEDGRDHVYLEHLNRIMEPLVADGHEVMFWADLFRLDPTLIPKIPAGAVPVVWNYEAPSESSWAKFLPEEVVYRLGLPEDMHLGFVSHARLFVESETPFWVAPGTATWNTIIGRNQNATGNIADAVSVGTAHGSAGILLTDWGDNGHWQPLAVSLPSIVRCGAAAQLGEMPTDQIVWARIDEICGFDAGTGRLLDELGNIGESIGITAPNGSPLCVVLQKSGLTPFGEAKPEAVRAAQELLARVTATFSTGSVGGERGEIVAVEMAAAVALAGVGLDRIAKDAGLVLAAGPALDDVLDAQRVAWLRSSRPGGLDDSIAKVRLQ